MEKQYACDQFAKDMQIRNFSSKTSQGYMSQINRFIDYCGEVPPSKDIKRIENPYDTLFGGNDHANP